MRIIKHKTRRRESRRLGLTDGGYYAVEGMSSFGDVEAAADIAMECWAIEIKAAPQAATIWDAYGRAA
jgi:hypothetical protein